MRFDSDLRATLVGRLNGFQHRPAPPEYVNPGKTRRAAVCLIVVDQGDGEAALLVTRRASRLRAHAGQFALPGGKLDEGETPLEAALREAREEIGLHLAGDAVLGRLDEYPTRSGYVITPIVAWAEDASAMAANPHEVETIFRPSLDHLARETRPIFISIPESDRPVIRYPVLDKLIHAPTAAMLYQFVEVALLGHTRVAHLEQPVWAWK